MEIMNRTVVYYNITKKTNTNNTLASIVSDVQNGIAIKTEGELDTLKPEYSAKMKLWLE